jgi:hypothetical protein
MAKAVAYYDIEINDPILEGSGFTKVRNITLLITGNIS